jgi:hypothetical protein
MEMMGSEDVYQLPVVMEVGRDRYRAQMFQWIRSRAEFFGLQEAKATRLVCDVRAGIAYQRQAKQGFHLHIESFADWIV